jgi:hypothetical protein
MVYKRTIPHSNKNITKAEAFTSKELFGFEGQDSTCPSRYQGISSQATQIQVVRRIVSIYEHTEGI